MKGSKRNRRKEKIWFKMTYSVLEKIFAAPRFTIQSWVRKGLLDPTNPFDIIDKYNNPWKLDRRKKPLATHLPPQSLPDAGQTKGQSNEKES